MSDGDSHIPGGICCPGILESPHVTDPRTRPPEYAPRNLFYLPLLSPLSCGPTSEGGNWNLPPDPHSPLYTPSRALAGLWNLESAPPPALSREAGEGSEKLESGICRTWALWDLPHPRETPCLRRSPHPGIWNLESALLPYFDLVTRSNLMRVQHKLREPSTRFIYPPPHPTLPPAPLDLESRNPESRNLFDAPCPPPLESRNLGISESRNQGIKESRNHKENAQRESECTKRMHNKKRMHRVRT